MPIDLEQQIACAERELDRRKVAYPRQVEAGNMVKDDADRELETMAAIVKTLKWMGPRAADIRQWFADQDELKRMRDHPAAQAVLKEFPNATMTIRQVAE